MMDEQIFISHSGNDKEILDRVLEHFDDTGVKPVLMEKEKWSRMGKPNWIWIKAEIEKSKALFVVLTQGVVSKPWTQNWVAFEIGVAAECNPPKSVYVIREEDIDFPVPYLDHYLPYPVGWKDDGIPWLVPQHKEFMKNFRSRMMKEIIKDPVNDTVTPRVKCSNCKTDFAYHGSHLQFPCPCCCAEIVREL